RRFPTNLRAAALRISAIGYGGVLGSGGDAGFSVVARARVWPILSHELTKGVMELICLHGLCDLDAAMYRRVLRAADCIEYEPWLLQTGCELWRRMLPLMPDGVPVADVMMRIAQLSPDRIDELLLSVMEAPDT